MKIKELYIENFGKLSKFKASFSDGLNSFVEDNGYGKTTLSVFIKAMLYGFDDTRRHSLDENDRKKYTPWQGGAFGGYLVFQARGVEYRIERTFAAKASDDTYKLYNLNTGRESNDFGSVLGEELFGIDADGFERTVFLSEKNLSGKNTNQTISAKLSNLVGTEGDIGGFDEAIKLLDERRKFYQKRGGAGEIQDVELEISELEDKIKFLYAKREASIKTEEEIAEFNEKINSLKAKKALILEKEQKERLEKEKLGYEIQYRDMLGALKTDERREEELLEFFKLKLPSNSEIALAADSASEITRLEGKLSDMGENLELSSLKEFFANETTSEECDKMKVNARRIAESRAAMFSARAQTHTPCPFKRVPTVDEIDSHIARFGAPQKKLNTLSISLLIIGILVTIIGLFAGATINNTLHLFTASGILLILVVILPTIIGKKQNSKSLQVQSAHNFLRDVYGENKEFNSEIDALCNMREELLIYLEQEKTASLVNREKESFAESIIILERELREFLEKYPQADGLSLEEKAEVIAYKHRRYEILLEFEAEKENERSLCKQSIMAHKERLTSFTSLFPIKTEDPISEIRRNLAEYEVIKGSLSRRRNDAERFAALHGIDLIQKNDANLTYQTESNFSEELSSLEEELISLLRDKTRLESEYSISMREIEIIEELEEKLLEKKDKIELFKDNLNVITKTKDMLAKSRDSMTARYLDSTKRGFEKYVSLIDEASEEFTIDTSFTVMKTELGKSRQAEAYSRGTRDMHSLAMRLSLIDALYGEETPPIILDDPFIAFDDTHVDRASQVLKRLARERQIFYFTCSRSRKIK